MPPRVGRAVLALSAMGFPLTQRVIRRFGLRGALVVEAACGGLLARDAAMIAAGVPRRLRRGAAVLLWLEAAAGAAAVLTGLRPLFDATARERAVEACPDRLETARRAAIGALFTLHTIRFRIYLQPGQGLRQPRHTPPSAS